MGAGRNKSRGVPNIQTTNLIYYFVYYFLCTAFCKGTKLLLDKHCLTFHMFSLTLAAAFTMFASKFFFFYFQTPPCKSLESVIH